RLRGCAPCREVYHELAGSTGTEVLPGAAYRRSCGRVARCERLIETIVKYAAPTVIAAIDDEVAVIVHGDAGGDHRAARADRYLLDARGELGGVVELGAAAPDQQVRRQTVSEGDGLKEVLVTREHEGDGCGQAVLRRLLQRVVQHRRSLRPRA